MSTKKSNRNKKRIDITIVPYREMSQLWRGLHKEFPNVKEAVEVLKDMNRVLLKNVSRINKQFEEVRKFFVNHEEPYAEISQNHRQFLVNMKLPDVSKKDIFVKVERNAMEIKGVKRQRHEGKKRMIGFYRTIALPQNVNPERAQASFKNDILKIKVPKLPQQLD